MTDTIQAGTIPIHGDQGDLINAYFAHPLETGPHPGVVVIHHNPGFDAATKEITRNFAVHGYAAICPNLHYREAPGASPDDASAAVRADGGVPDDRCVGDVAGAIEHLRAHAGDNSIRVGLIGYCSGGRQAVLCACRLRVDAVIDCYGGRVVAGAAELRPRQPVAPIDLIGDLSAPLLGLFGAEDRNPDQAQVETLRAGLLRHAKAHEFHIYPEAGHAFFAVDRPAYRVAAALDGWERIWEWFGRHLAPATTREKGGGDVHADHGKS